MKNKTWMMALVLVVSGIIPIPVFSTIIVGGLIVDTLDDGSKTNAAASDEFPRIHIRDIPLTSPGAELAPSRDRMPMDQMDGRAGMHARDGDVFMDRRQWESALREYQRALRMDPHNLAYVYRVAVSATLAGSYGLADTHFDRFIRANPDHVSSLLGRAGVLVRLGRFEQANALIDRVLEINPTELGARFNKTLLRVMESDDIDGLRKDWMRIGFLDTRHIVQWLQSDRDELLRVMPLQKYQNAARIMLGEGSQKHLPEIVESFRAATTAFNQSDWPAYSAQLERIKLMGVQTAGIELELARSYVEQGRYPKAREIMETLVERHPDDAMIAYNCGFTLMYTKSFSEAKEMFERTLAIDETHADARFGLACAHMSLDQPDQAWPILTALAREYPERMPSWLEGDTSYLQAIREHPDYAALEALFQE